MQVRVEARSRRLGRRPRRPLFGPLLGQADDHGRLEHSECSCISTQQRGQQLTKRSRALGPGTHPAPASRATSDPGPPAHSRTPRADSTRVFRIVMRFAARIGHP